MKTAPAFLAGLILAFAPMAHAGGALDLLLGTTGSGSTPGKGPIALDYGSASNPGSGPASWGGSSASYTTGSLAGGQEAVIGVGTVYPYAFTNYLNTPSGWSNLGSIVGPGGNFGLIMDQLPVTSAAPVTYAPPVTTNFLSSGGELNVFTFRNVTSTYATGLGTTSFNSGSGSTSSLSLTTVNASPANSTIFVFVATADNGGGWGGATVTDTVGNVYVGVGAWDIGNSGGIFFYSVGAAALPAGDVITATVPGGMTNGAGMSAGSLQ